MSGPAPGNYRLQNYQSQWTLTTKTSQGGVSQPGDVVKTEKGADRAFPEESKFIVSVGVGGQYSFRNLNTKMYIGSGTDKDGNPAAVWTTSAQFWDVDPIGPGYWAISMPGAANSFWYDSSVGGNPWSEVLLQANKNLVQYYWYFVAA
ncbi:hypothetical protein CVT24_010075 [Panaeolus cyanescens]|uniref:Ricin B lectin domain-containing protein n=1 Tax=Panaeolus cyanescens TaxID=181874 RepID=A0A409W930_9AGAR|nr:hypothetical protein CVT24_010075 [Panaeolus cyanescens]